MSIVAARVRHSLAAFALLPALAASAVAQSAGNSFSLEQVLSYPFPQELVAAPSGARIAWVFNERGVRNIYAADGPSWTAKQLTHYTADDGQELTNLSFSPDGQTVV